MLHQIPVLEPSREPLRQPLVQPFQPDPSCVLWLLPQRDSKWYDYSGKGNHGVIHGAVWEPSPAGVGLAFDGSDDYVNCGHDSSLVITDAITVAAWIKRTEWTLSDTIVSKNHLEWEIRSTTNGPISVYKSDGAGSAEQLMSNVIYKDNNFHHLVNSFDPITKEWKIYLDGAYKDKMTFSSGSLTNPTSHDLNIGSRRGTADFFNGSIGGVKIYNRALSAEEIALSWRVERSWYGV